MNYHPLTLKSFFWSSYIACIRGESRGGICREECSNIANERLPNGLRRPPEKSSPLKKNWLLKTYSRESYIKSIGQHKEKKKKRKGITNLGQGPLHCQLWVIWAVFPPKLIYLFISGCRNLFILIAWKLPGNSSKPGWAMACGLIFGNDK